MKSFTRGVRVDTINHHNSEKGINTKSLLPAMILLFACMLPYAFPGALEAESLPNYLSDRGEGVSISMFGTYIKPGELIVYPFYEYYYDSDSEYDPSEFGYGTAVADYRGKFTGHEALIFIGYGINDNLAVEFEVAVIDAKLEKADNDPSTMPDEISESGLGDVEGQIRWRFMEENQSRPELFTYFETVFPFQKDKKIIGTQDWEFKLGIGVVKGFDFGTMTFRTSVEYDRGESIVEFGEYAIEYLKRLSDQFRIFLAVEGQDDEVEMIPELQWHFSKNKVAKCSLGLGLTSKATDFAPELGIMFIF